MKSNASSLTESKISVSRSEVKCSFSFFFFFFWLNVETFRKNICVTERLIKMNYPWFNKNSDWKEQKCDSRETSKCFPDLWNVSLNNYYLTSKKVPGESPAVAPRGKTEAPEVAGRLCRWPTPSPGKAALPAAGNQGCDDHGGEATAGQVLLDSRGREGEGRGGKESHSTSTHGVGSPSSSIQCSSHQRGYKCFTWGMRSKSFNPIEAWFSNLSSSPLIYNSHSTLFLDKPFHKGLFVSSLKPGAGLVSLFCCTDVTQLEGRECGLITSKNQPI